MTTEITQLHDKTASAVELATAEVPDFTWVSASKTRNFCLEDPLLDWLALFGRQHGYTPESERAGYEERTDFLPFIFEKGQAFERAVVEHLRRSMDVVQIAQSPSDVFEGGAVLETFEAMCSGVPLIHQGVLWNPRSKTYGMADLLARSDVLTELFPGSLSRRDASIGAPAIAADHWHYRVIDVKFTNLKIQRDGLAAGKLPYLAQVFIYNEALGLLQGYLPPAGYILGRGFEETFGAKRRGDSALDLLGPVAHDRHLRNRGFLRDIVGGAVQWIRRLRTEGASWRIEPEPSVEELRPNLRNTKDQPWHQVKREIAERLRDLSIVPRMSPEKRRIAMHAGIRTWDDPRCTASALGITGQYATQIDGILEVNRSPAGDGVRPDRIRVDAAAWRPAVEAEFFVDFETVSDLDDDFSSFPTKNGRPLIFMIGCGRLERREHGRSEWVYRRFSVDRLTDSEERRIILEWLEFMAVFCRERGIRLDATRLYHWSNAEVSNLSSAYNAAARRHGFPEWSTLPWVDLLTIARSAPLAVRGAFGFGLKAIAGSLHALGHIETSWGDGPTDGLGAMVGAWWCEREAERTGTSMNELPLMQEIGAYNEVDCRVMAELLDFLRRTR